MKFKNLDTQSQLKALLNLQEVHTRNSSIDIDNINFDRNGNISHTDLEKFIINQKINTSVFEIKYYNRRKFSKKVNEIKSGLHKINDVN